MKKYYFRVDGGNIYSIAIGHIARCLKLAEYIAAKEKAAISFIMKDYPEGIELVRKKFKVFTLKKSTGRKEEIEILNKIIDTGSYFICDLRDIDDDYIRGVKKRCGAFILFDDLIVRDAHPDILINPSPFCSRDYNKSEYPHTDLLLGERYFFMRSGLIDKSQARNFQKKRYSIMASFGGADPMNITEFFIRNIAPEIKGHDISVILGPAYMKKEEIMKKYKDTGSLHFFTNIFPLDEMLSSHDIAFVCGGDTAVEACTSGTATFIISSIGYEKKFAQLLHEKGMAHFVADIEDIKIDKLSRGYMDILSDKNRLEELSRNGMALTDGGGLERIYKFISKKEVMQ